MKTRPNANGALVMPYEPPDQQACVGDVLLFHDEGDAISWLIQKFDGTEWNHSAHVISATELAQSDMGPGVGTIDLQGKLDASKKVGIFRLKTLPADYGKVINRTSWYLARHDRYDYEAIVLLAFLAITRRIPLPWLARHLLRLLLDKAASLLIDLEHRNKEPMICSAFTFKCFNEAIPDRDDDQYTIDVDLAPNTVRSGARITETRLRGRGIEAGSLLGQVLLRGAMSESREPMVTAEGLDAPSEAELRAAAEDYIHQLAASPTGDGGALQELSQAPDVLESLDRFAHAVASVHATVPSGIQALNSRLYREAAYETLAAAADAFVSPGDLSKSGSLLRVAIYHGV